MRKKGPIALKGGSHGIVMSHFTPVEALRAPLLVSLVTEKLVITPWIGCWIRSDCRQLFQPCARGLSKTILVPEH
ncbi:MAG TPA: hypothetical protein DD856_12405 [Sulfobacillus sp.]|nr:hypothetical protein [Sulfobacillus sp.]